MVGCTRGFFWRVSLFRRTLALAAFLNLTAAAISAQRVSLAAVGRDHGQPHDISASRADSVPSLSRDIKRGSTVGAITGAVIGAVGIAAYISANTGDVCCDQPPHHIRARDMIAIGAASTFGGGIVGAILGYSYHFNRAARTASRLVFGPVAGAPATVGPKT